MIGKQSEMIWSLLIDGYIDDLAAESILDRRHTVNTGVYLRMNRTRSGRLRSADKPIPRELELHIR
jgi:hypothetical protein